MASIEEVKKPLGEVTVLHVPVSIGLLIGTHFYPPFYFSSVPIDLLEAMSRGIIASRS
jgi:hypothetical protein